jgi:glycosyltransferase involved in cell wall biosynthesis
MRKNVLNSKLRINWIMAKANLSGGTKSNRLIAEAMVRRGHEVNIAFVALPIGWPKPWQIRKWLRRAKEEIMTHGRKQHHLEQSTANLIPVMDWVITPDKVPDADVSIATWWLTREWIEDWPVSKGIKAYFIRHHELHGGDPRRVAATYRLKGLKFVIAKWLQEIMTVEYDDPNAVLVPNGVDRSQFDSKPRGKSKIPTVGMLYGSQEWKGAETAFEALRLIRSKYPDLRAIAFGSKPLSRIHKPPTWLEFYLRPSQDKIPQLYQQTDCWIVPSTTEGFGMPGLEAAASHCPIVSTRCGGPEDYIEEGISGFLVPVGDSEAMADAVCRVLDLTDDQWCKMSDASYDLSKRFDWERSAEILENALLRALSDQGYRSASTGT